MEKQNKSVGKTILIVALLLVTIAALVLATYAWAKYTSSEQGTATATVAKWDVSFDKGTSVFSKTFTNVKTERLAPGTDGKFDLTITSNDTEVAYTYTIEMANITNKPTNLKFYSDAECTTEIELEETTTGSGIYKTKTSAFTGTVNLNEEGKAITSQTPAIYWKWPFETGTTEEEKKANDVIDTTEGQAAKTMSFDVTLTAIQVAPVAQ